LIRKDDILYFYKVRFDGNIIKSDEELDLLPNGSLIHIDNSDNQIKKVHNDEFMFIRKDTIDTVKHTYKGKARNLLQDRIYKKLDYNLDYSKGRVELLHKLVEGEENLYWILELLSCDKSINKDLKTKKDFLSEDQPLDSKIEGLANYLLHPKFNDEEHEKYHNDLKDMLDKVKGKTESSDNIKDTEFKIKEEISDILSHTLTKSKEQCNKFREELSEDISKVELFSEKEDNFSHEKKPKRYGKQLKLTPTYWKQMGFKDYQFRNNIINTYQQTIQDLGKYLGVNLSKEEKEIHQQELVDSMETIEFNVGKKEVKITPEQRIGKLNRMYSEVVSDFYTAKERLSEIVSFQSPTKPNSEMQFVEDTWYINESGEEVEVSKNLVLFSDPNTYSGLIQNYYSLYDKYKDKFNHDMWAILHTFRQIVKETDLSKEELFVIDGFSNDKTREEIKSEYITEFNKDISDKVLSTWVNRSIPKKMLNTYLESVDDWLYTYKIKGDFKKCSKCGETKVISNGRYFGKNSITKDGFQSTCRKCDNLRKNGKK